MTESISTREPHLVLAMPVGNGHMYVRGAESEAAARDLVRTLVQDPHYSVSWRDAEFTCEAGEVNIWRINAATARDGRRYVTGYTFVGAWELDGLGGAKRLENGSPAGLFLDTAQAILEQFDANEGPSWELG